MLTRTLRGLLRLYRDAYTGLPPSVWLLAVVMLINRCGTMVLAFLTLYLTQHLHYSIEQAGVVNHRKAGIAFGRRDKSTSLFRAISRS